MWLTYPKTLLISLIIFFHQGLMARDYFVSTKNPNANDLNDGSKNSPWKTLEKVNAMMTSLKPGDRVLFERGSTFEGTLDIKASGLAGQPITFKDYGSGSLPIFRGSREVTGFVPTATNHVWKTVLSNAPEEIRLIFQDNQLLPMGRYPNLDAPNKGYLSIDEGGNSAYEIVDRSFNFRKDHWKGATAVIRAKRWALNEVKIQSNVSGKIMLEDIAMRHQPDYIPRTNFGYYIQNHPRTLDQNGEWYYNPSNGELLIYSDTDFSQARIRFSNSESLVKIHRRAFIILQNLKLIESNVYGIDMLKSERVVLSNVMIEEIGEKGIQTVQTNHVQINNSLIRKAYDVAANLSGNHYQVVNNEFYEIGLIRGMGFNYGCLIIDVNHLLVEKNRIKDIGYMGINFSGNNVLIQKNEISHVCRILDDGAAIYTFNGFEKRNEDGNRVVQHNYIHDVLGALDGAGYTIPLSCGVYLDSGVRNVKVQRNTVRDCYGPGVYIHNASFNEILDNNLYFNVSGVDVTDDNTSSIRCRDNLVKNNKVLMISKGLQSLRVNGTKDTGDFKRLAEIDDNFYSDPFYNSRVRYSKAFGDLGVLTLDKWKSIYGLDSNSKGTPVIYPSFLVDTYLDDNLIKNGSFDHNHWKEWICQKDCNIQVDSSQIEFEHNRSEDAVWDYVEFYQDINAERTGIYEISFKAKAALSKKNIYFYMRQNKYPYKKISDLIFVPLSNEMERYRFFFENYEATEGASIVIRTSALDGLITMDDIQLRPVTIKERNIEELMDVVYNHSEESLNHRLEGTDYVSIENKIYTKGTVITIPPYQSAAFFKILDYDDLNPEEIDTLLRAPDINHIFLDEEKAIEILWKDRSKNEKGYWVQRKDGDGRYKFLDALPRNSQKFIDRDIEPNQVYTYRVRPYLTLERFSSPAQASLDIRSTFEGIYLSDLDTRTKIYPLGDTAQVDLKLIQNINPYLLAIPSESLDSVIFTLAGKFDLFKNDQRRPYEFLFNLHKIPAGTYSLRAEPYLNGRMGIPRDIQLSIQNGNVFKAINLYEAQNDTLVGNLMEESNLNIDLSKKYGIEADAGDIGISSMTFSLGGKRNYFRLERDAPFSLFGDREGEIKGSSWEEGWYSLHARIFTDIGEKRIYWNDMIIYFRLEDGQWKVLKVNPSAKTALDNPQLESEGISVYPTPVKNNLYLQLPAERACDEIQLSLFNSQGYLIKQEKLKEAIDDGLFNLSVNNLSPGFYILKTESCGQLKTQKILIEE